MKKEIIEIFDIEFKSHKHKKFLISYVLDLIDFYEDNRQASTIKFQTLLNKYNFETMPIFSVRKHYPHVTLFHGSGGLEFSSVIDYEGGITDIDLEIGLIIEEPQIWPQEISFDSPVYNEISDLIVKLRHNIAFIWLCTIWQNCKGYEYGIVIKTLENNSVRQFIFNDLSWQDISEFGFYNNRECRIAAYFRRDLSIFEIYQRINFHTYPLNPYENTWRMFKSQHSCIEIAAWGNEIAERKDGGILKVSQKEDLKDRMISEKQKSDTLINNGYQEVFYEKIKEQIHEAAIEFKFHSGIHWYANELSNRLDVMLIEKFETKFNISLPFHFKQYLKLLNGRKFNNYYTNFFYNEHDTVKIKEFYNLEELQKVNVQNNSLIQKVLFNKLSNEWLKIAITDKEEDLVICLIEEDNFGKLCLKKHGKLIKDLDVEFSEFIKQARY